MGPPGPSFNIKGFTVKVFFQPQPKDFPSKGGVATHLRKLYSHLSDKVELVDNPNLAHVLHVESAYPIPRTNYIKPTIYVCHGGFVPPIKVVDVNLREADVIVSVAQWVADKYFPKLSQKTQVIPNGIDLEEFEPGENKGYVLYAKEWDYYFEDILSLLKVGHKVVSTVWPGSIHNLPKNLTYIGLQSHEVIKAYVRNAGCLILTGSEVNPVMMLEAWASKVPVVARAIDGSQEMFDNNGHRGGLLYDSEPSLLAAIDTVLSNRDRIGQEGFEVVQKYQWKDIAQRYIQIYDDFYPPL